MTHLDPGVVSGIQGLECRCVFMQHCNAVVVVGDLIPTEVELLQLGQGLDDERDQEWREGES